MKLFLKKLVILFFKIEIFHVQNTQLEYMLNLLYLSIRINYEISEK